MKSYTKLVERRYKTQRKKSFLAVLGIFIGILLLTATLAFFKYMNLREINRVNQRGEYDASFSYDETVGLIKNTLDKNIYVDSYGQYSKGGVDFLDKKLGASSMMIDETIIDDIAKEGLEYNNIKMPSDKSKVLASNYLENMGVKTGDTVIINDTEYIVDGFFDYYDGMILGHFNKKDEKNINTNTLVRVKGDKSSIRNNIDSLSTDIGYYKGQTEEGFYNNGYPLRSLNNARLRVVYGIENKSRYLEYGIILLIILITVITSYGLINFSLTSKIKEFGILRCIGASPSQIKALVYKEVFLISAMGIIPASIMGYFLAYIVIAYLNSKSVFENYNVSFTFYFEVIIFVLVLSFLTIFLASINPARKASKITPIEGVKDTLQIKMKPKKYLFTKQIRKTLGVEADIAYRNLRAKASMFGASTSLLIVCFVAFIAITQGLTYLSNTLTNSLDGKYQISVSSSVYELVNKPMYKYDEFMDFNEFKNIDNQKQKDYIKTENKEVYEKVYKDRAKSIEFLTPYAKDIIMYTDGLNLNSVLFENLKLKDGVNEKDYNLNKFDKGLYEGELKIIAINEAYFNLIKDDIKGENITYDNFKNSAILLDRPSYVDFTRNQIINYKNGDSLDFKIPYENIDVGNFEYDSKKESYIYPVDYISEYKEHSFNKSIPIMGEIERKNALTENMAGANGGISIIISDEYLKDNILDFTASNKLNHSFGTNIYFDLKNNIDKQTFEKNFAKEKITGNIYDLEENLANMREITGIIKVLAYGFISMVLIILVMSLLINRKLTFEGRKKEYGGLLALGMERGAIIKTIIYEGIIQSVLIVVFGMPLAIITTKFIEIYFKFEEGLVIAQENFSYLYILGIGVIFIIMLITSLIPVISFKKFDMVKMMKAEE